MHLLVFIVDNLYALPAAGHKTILIKNSLRTYWCQLILHKANKKHLLGRPASASSVIVKHYCCSVQVTSLPLQLKPLGAHQSQSERTFERHGLPVLAGFLRPACQFRLSQASTALMSSIRPMNYLG
jgi:hypothetical protein